MLTANQKLAINDLRNEGYSASDIADTLNIDVKEIYNFLNIKKTNFSDKSFKVIEEAYKNGISPEKISMQYKIALPFILDTLKKLGYKNVQSVFEQHAAEIRLLYKNKVPKKIIAQKFNISQHQLATFLRVKNETAKNRINILQLHRQGLEVAQIAHKLNVTKFSVYSTLKIDGIKVNRGNLKFDSEELFNLHNKGFPVKEIAKTLNMKLSTVYYHISKTQKLHTTAT